MRRAFDHLEHDEREFLIAMLDAGRASVREDAIFGKLNAQGIQSAKVAARLLDQFVVRDGSGLDRLLGSTGYRWVHPSWRDLIIEHVMEDEKDRQRFLEHTGIDGLILAVSSFGGATGTREFPLLRNERAFSRSRCPQSPRVQTRTWPMEHRKAMSRFACYPC
jgi:hypothetical protein